MIPTVTPLGPPPPTAPTQSAQKSSQPQVDAPRSSAGEFTGVNQRAETARAIDAPVQSAVAQRLQDQEKKERPETIFDDLVGPDPTFEENLLERQARVAFDPPEVNASPSQIADPVEEDTLQSESDAEIVAFEGPPPTPTEKAEASFAETRTLATDPEPVTIDVAR